MKNNLYLRPLMKILIKQARIVDASSPFAGQTADIFIENGIITSIGKKISNKPDKEISIEGLHVSPGWVDVFAHFNDPGKEHKETLETGSNAAAAGGFTDVLVIPNTQPVLHNKANVEYITHKSKALPVTIHPIGAITKNTEGKELAEMYDMHSSGAVAFSDGLNPVQSAGLLLKALLYVKAIDAPIIQLPDDAGINPQGLMNEGIVSTRLGLAGKPAMAEELVIARDLKLARYTESRIHFTAVTTKKSLEYIKRGKESGIDVSCSVTPYHLFFADEELTSYDTNLKVNPPLRTKDEKNALRSAVIEGVIDCIATHHLPHEKDSKIVEFQNAEPGMIGLETAYAVVNTSIDNLSVERTVELFSLNPRRIFNLPTISIKEHGSASLTLFIPGKKWIFTEADIRSRSKNSPFIGKELTGKVVGIINNNQAILNK
jgi:dihydroorotase